MKRGSRVCAVVHRRRAHPLRHLDEALTRGRELAEVRRECTADLTRGREGGGMARGREGGG